MDSQAPISEQQPLQQPVVMPSQRSRFPLIVVFFFVVVFAVSGGYYLGQRGKSTTPPTKIATSLSPSQTLVPTKEVKVDDTANWKIYTNSNVGFSFKYPSDADLYTGNKGSENLIVDVQLYQIETLSNDGSGVGGVNKEQALTDQKALSKGEYGIDKYDFEVPESQLVTKLGNSTVFGKQYMVLSRFAVGDIGFERTLRFVYNANYVIITLYGPKKKIMADMPQYFIRDPKLQGAWDWNREKIPDYSGDFYKDLKNHKGQGAAQYWYDTFDKMLTTFTISASKTTAGCKFSDANICTIIDDLKQIVADKNVNGILKYQVKQKVQCDTKQPFNPTVCIGVPDAQYVEGYSIVRNQSEGDIYPEDEYKKRVAALFASSAPYTYHDSLFEDDKGIIVFLSRDENDLLVFPFKKITSEWKTEHVLIGFASEDYKKLNRSVLSYY